jgi:S-(hydroxymethyl)glutathione dehydrogenase/alcohol dehydrogenase
MAKKEITLNGTYYSSVWSAVDIPTTVYFYQAGKFDIDSLITRTYKLDDTKKAYQDMGKGQMGMGIITEFCFGGP